MFSGTLLRIGGRIPHSPRVMDWNVMKELACDEFLEEMLIIRIIWDRKVLTSDMWIRAFNIREPIYKEWCLEFLCSMQMKERITDVGAMTDKFLTFRLGGKKHEVTLFELGNLLGLYSDKDLSNKDFKFLIITGVRNKSSFDAHGYWKQISTEDNLEYGKSKVSSIKTPLLKVLH